MSSTLNKSLTHVALAMLARREHSRQELQLKLANKGFELQDIEPVLDFCESKHYLDDYRYGEMVIRSHMGKGHGLLRIKQTLIQKGLGQEHIGKLLSDLDCDWYELAKNKAIKKYGIDKLSCQLEDKEKIKRIRYLLGQGFNYEQANYALTNQQNDSNH